MWNNNQVVRICNDVITRPLITHVLHYFLLRFIPSTADATNLFLKQNGHEVIKAMQPQLEKKIASEFERISNSLIDKVPVDDFYKD